MPKHALPESHSLISVPGRPKRRTWRQEVLGLHGLMGVILLALWGLAIGFLAFQKQSLVEDAQRELGHLRSAVAQHTEGLFRTVETDLRVIDRWLQDRPGIDPVRDRGFNSLVDDMRKASAGLIDPRMVSTRGQLHYLPARDAQPLADVSDRPYYREALKLDAGQLHIGDPVLSRVTGKWGIPVSMRLTKPVGGMQVVFAAIELDRLHAFHEQFRIQPSGAVAVLRRDGVFLSRTPFDARLIGRNFSDQPWFKLMLQEVRGATITAGTLTNNPPRLQNFEQLQGYPLIVSVSRNVDDVLTNFYERRGIILVVVAAITVLGLFFAWRLHRTQRDLHQSVAMLMAAGDASPLGQFRTDAQGRLVAVNEAWRRIHGIREDQPPQDWAGTMRLESGLAVAMASQAYLPEGEHALRTADDRLLLLKVRRADIVVDGVVLGCSGTVDDITASKAAERQLHEGERRLRAITDSVPALIAEIGADGVYRFANRVYEAWLGISHEDILGRTVAQVFGRKLFETIGPYHERAFRGERVDYVREGRHAGQSRWLHVTLVPRLDENGQPDGCYAIGFDITESRKIEAALRQNERLLTSITDRMPMRLSYVDHEQRYRFVNLAYEQAFSRPRQSWHGRTVHEVLGDAAYQKAEPYIQRALQGEVVSFDGELTTAGGYRSYRSDYVPQFSEDGGSVVGFVCIITDTTGQKLEERRLIALSQRDPLTGLLNRSGFDGRLRDALQHAQATQSYLAVMYLDIDRFKLINDKLGHLMGDLLLQAFGGRLSKTLRTTDTVVRLGGDEFAILLEEIDSPLSAARVAENIVQAMQAPFILEDRSVAVTTSIGVAVQAGSVPVTPRELMRRADEQLYAAKGLGRNRYSMEKMGA